jgi:hypothetical protein
MSERGITEFLNDILEAIKRIQDYTFGMDYLAFLDDLKTRGTGAGACKSANSGKKGNTKKWICAESSNN